MKKRFMAFTLAEVLITLSIIGIVAALTIPTLINNYQKKQYVTSLKKFYTQFNQVLAQIAVDNGCPGNLACTGLYASDKTNITLGDEIVKYFKVAKNCKTSTTKGCWATKSLWSYDGSSPDSFDNKDGSTYYKFTTVDNMSIAFYNNGLMGGNWADCKQDGYSRHITGHMNQVCGDVAVDVNGPKGPNRYGIDTFYFWITNGKGPLIYPYGGVDSDPYRKATNPARCTTGNPDGTHCAARIMEEGWEMNY